MSHDLEITGEFQMKDICRSDSDRVRTAGKAVLGWSVPAGMLLAMMTLLAPATADDWPQFRGPNCSGISAGIKPLPVKFSATENVRWSARVGDGVGGSR